MVDSLGNELTLRKHVVCFCKQIIFMIYCMMQVKKQTKEIM